MKNYKITLAYDGTRYNGWQKQGNTENTIQERLERILKDIGGQETEVFGSGRTDMGTHATGQVMNFHMKWKGSAESLLDAFNAKLPEDIAGISIEEKEPRFHSRLSAKAKHYSYSIWKSKKAPVFERKYVFRCEEELDIQAMKQAASAFIGEHDFKSFCSVHTQAETTVRTITAVDVEKQDSVICIRVSGTGFLYNMVRIIAGTLMEVGCGKYPPEKMKEILEKTDRSAAGPTAPAKGLMLVNYEFL